MLRVLPLSEMPEYTRGHLYVVTQASMGFTNRNVLSIPNAPMHALYTPDMTALCYQCHVRLSLFLRHDCAVTLRTPFFDAP